MFVLATFADGPYWTSSLEPLCYPIGISFYRPFSYRTNYVFPDTLLEVFTSAARLSTFLKDPLQNTGVFGMRFRDSTHRGNFVPLRKITLTSIVLTDTIQIRFSVGDYVKLSPDGTLPLINIADVVPVGQSE